MNYGNAWDERDTGLLDDGSTKRSGELFGNPEQVPKTPDRVQLGREWAKWTRTGMKE